MSKTLKADRGLVNLGVPEALYPVLGLFIDLAKNIPNLRFAVLFGSTVTGEFRKKSDIDILLAFETDHDPELGPEAEAALHVSSLIAGKFDLANSFSFVYVNLRSPNLDAHFLWQVAKEGIIIWGDPALILGEMAHTAAQPQAIG